MDAEFESEYAGLMLFSDNSSEDANGIPDFAVESDLAQSDEATHMFIIYNVTDVEFTNPFNSSQSSGSQVVAANESISFGISLDNVYGEMFPLYGLLTYGSGGFWNLVSGYLPPWYSTSDFDKRVVPSRVDEIEFDIDYSVHLSNTTENPDPNNHEIDIKIDQYIGNWELSPSITYNNEALENRSLAIGYFSDLRTETETNFTIDDQPPSDTNGSSQIGDVYRFGSENRTFTYVRMGGQEYTWGKDGNTYNCSAATVPIGVFERMYEDEEGTSITRWDFEDSFYFLLSGFSNWDGYSIDNDPAYGIYTDGTYVSPIVGPTTPHTTPYDNTLTFGIIVVTGCAIVISVVVLKVAKKG
jgi:hypothetical protein